MTRAYAWTNETVWHQGVKTLAEIELDLKCYGYGEDAEMDDVTRKEYVLANVGKAPRLAARWSFDPIHFNGNLQSPADGIAGRSSRL